MARDYNRYGGGRSAYGKSSSSYDRGGRGGSLYDGGSSYDTNEDDSSYDFMTGPSYFNKGRNNSGRDDYRNTRSEGNSARQSGMRGMEEESISERSQEVRRKVDGKRSRGNDNQNFFVRNEGSNNFLKYENLPSNKVFFHKPSSSGKSKSFKLKRFFKKYLWYFFAPIIIVFVAYGAYSFYRENMSMDLNRNALGKVEIKSISDADFISVLRTGTPDEIDRAFSLSPNVNLVDEKGRDIISIAILNNANDSSIMHLLDHVEDVNKKDTNGMSPLANAILFHRNVPIIKKIIARGANVNDISERGTSVLMTAAAVTDSPEVMKTLISNGADVNYKNSNQVTPLMMAVTTSANPEIVKVLLGGGADPLAKDENGKSILEIAQKNPALVNTDVITVIQSYYKPINQSSNNILQNTNNTQQQNYMNTSNAPSPVSSERTRNGPLPYGQQRQNNNTATGGSETMQQNMSNTSTPVTTPSTPSPQSTSEQVPNTQPNTNQQNNQNNNPVNQPTNGTMGGQNNTPNNSSATNNGITLNNTDADKDKELLIFNNKASDLVASELKVNNKKSKYLEYSKAYETNDRDVDQAALKEEELEYSGNKDMEDYFSQEEEANRNYSRYTRPSKEYSF